MPTKMTDVEFKAVLDDLEDAAAMFGLTLEAFEDDLIGYLDAEDESERAASAIRAMSRRSSQKSAFNLVLHKIYEIEDRLRAACE